MLYIFQQLDVTLLYSYKAIARIYSLARSGPVLNPLPSVGVPSIFRVCAMCDENQILLSFNNLAGKKLRVKNLYC
jgi:hypothetical protein